MKIHFYANLRTLVGQPTLEIAAPGPDTLRQLFDRLMELYPAIRPHLLDASGGLRPEAPVFVNGRNPRLDGMGLDAQLEPEDVISLFSPIASGKMNVEVMREPGQK
jgi:molybdopterin converting factor small subunit